MKNKLLIKVFIAIFLALIAGLLTGSSATIFDIQYVRIFDLIGKLFLNALTLVVIPLVISSIISGTARMGSDGAFETLGVKTFGYFFLTSLLAVAVGMSVAIWLQPGFGYSEQLLATNSATAQQFQAAASGDGFDKLQGVLLRIIPSNVLDAASQGQILGVILFSLLFGYFITKIPEESAKVLTHFWQGVFQVMMAITHLVMRFMPIGVFGLVAKVVATTGLQSFISVLYFFIAVLFGLAIHMLVVLPLLLKFIAGVNPFSHLKAMAPALVTAFSISSTAATLPVTIECMEKRAGVPNRICSFTLPLAASINLQGTALYCSMAVLFIAQAYGLSLPVGTLAIIYLLSFLSAFGMVAGIPSASIVTIVIILTSIGLPAEGIVLILAVERILDMSRTVVSVFGNSCVARLVHCVN